MTQDNKQRLFNYFHEMTDGKVLLMEDDYMFIENTIRPPKNNSEDVYRWVKCCEKTPDSGNVCYRQLWQNPHDEKHSEWMYFNGKVNEYDQVEDVDSVIGEINQFTVEWLEKINTK